MPNRWVGFDHQPGYCRLIDRRFGAEDSTDPSFSRQDQIVLYCPTDVEATRPWICPVMAVPMNYFELSFHSCAAISVFPSSKITGSKRIMQATIDILT